MLVTDKLELIRVEFKIFFPYCTLRDSEMLKNLSYTAANRVFGHWQKNTLKPAPILASVLEGRMSFLSSGKTLLALYFCDISC